MQPVWLMNLRNTLRPQEFLLYALESYAAWSLSGKQGMPCTCVGMTSHEWSAWTADPRAFWIRYKDEVFALWERKLWNASTYEDWEREMSAAVETWHRHTISNSVENLPGLREYLGFDGNAFNRTIYDTWVNYPRALWAAHRG